MNVSAINDAVNYELSDGIATITLNRPSQMNAFNEEMFSGLNIAMAKFRADETAHVCILASSGEVAFSAGLDIKAAEAMLNASDASGAKKFDVDFLESDLEGKPVIMAAFGHCIGQAVALGAWADICLCAEDTTFSLPEAKIGVNAVKLPGLLVDKLGTSQAAYMLLYGGTLNAEWALRAGFVQEIVPKTDLMDRARAIAAEMVAQAPLALRAHKQLLHAALKLPREELIAKGLICRQEALQSQDFREGVLAFAEKRAPQFKGH